MVESDHLEFKQRLADTVLALCVIGTQPAFLAHCIVLLRVAAFLEAFVAGGQELDRALKHGGRYVVELPRDLLFRSSAAAKYKSVRTSAQGSEATSTLQKRLADLQIAYQEVERASILTPLQHSELADLDPAPVHEKESRARVEAVPEVALDEPLLRLNRSDLSESSAEILDSLGLIGPVVDGLAAFTRLKHEIVSQGTHFHRLVADQETAGSTLAHQMRHHGRLLTAQVGVGTMTDFKDLTLPEQHLPPTALPHGLEQHGTTRVLGHGKLMRVEEVFQGCRLGQLAGIVNIPQGSVKQLEITTRERTQVETESEQVQETSIEETTETTESNSMASECEKLIEADLAMEAGVKVSASYGPIAGVEVSSKVSTGFSSSETSNSANSYAKEVTERAVKRMASKSRTLTKTLVDRERQQKETEGYTNQTGAHIVGIYHWVDEVFHARLVNYGTFLLLEFMVPEPGHMFHYMDGSPLPPAHGEPVPPPPFDLTPDDIKLDNYLALVALYGARDVAPPPNDYLAISKAYAIGDGVTKGSRVNMSFSDDLLAVPDGYEAVLLRGRLACSHNELGGQTTGRVRLLVQGASIELTGRSISFDRTPLTRGNIPLSLTGLEDRTFVLNVILFCKATPEVWQKWQLEVFSKLRQGYEQQISEYEDRLREFRRRPGVTITGGRNPQINRNREKEELKRSCISILTNQHFTAFDAVNDPGDQFPTINFNQAAAEGDYIRFFEWAFEWPQLTYVLYPYFWANPTKTWLRSLTLTNPDPKHEEFLRAGAARVVVPVRKEYQEALLHYLSTGIIWNGQDPDEVGVLDKMYVPVYTELMERQEQLDQAPIVEEEWDLIVPTSHQIIANGTPLPRPPFLP